MGLMSKIKSLIRTNESNQNGKFEDLYARRERGESLSIEESSALKEELDKRVKELERKDAGKSEIEEYYNNLKIEREKLIEEDKRLDSKINAKKAEISKLSAKVADLEGSKKMDTMFQKSAYDLLMRAEELKAIDKKDKVIREDEYPQIMEELIDYVKTGKYSGSSEKSVLAQCKYQSGPKNGKEIMFIPYLFEQETKKGKIRNDLPETIKEKMNKLREDNDQSMMIDALFEELDSGIVDWRKENVHSSIFSVMARSRNINPDEMKKLLSEQYEARGKYNEETGLYEVARTPRLYHLKDCTKLPDQYKDFIHQRSTQSSEFRNSMKVDVNIYEDAKNCQNTGEQSQNRRDSRLNPSIDDAR